MNPDKSSIENSRIEKLKKSLYSRNVDVVPKDVRSPIAEKNIDVPSSWGAPKTFEYTADPVSLKRNNSFFNKFLLISSIIFFISLGAAVFIFYGGLNMISSNNLDVRIIAPSSVSSGEELPIGLTIINGNRADLEEVYLVVDYPEGAQAVNSDKALIHDRINLGTIIKGGSTEYSLRAVLFGEKDVTKDFNFRIEYKVKGSNATFSKEKVYTVSLGSAPVLVDVDYPKETNSGQNVKFIVNLTSNSSVTLKNTLVKIDYPYGFTYKSSSIKPLRDNSLWNVGDLKNGEKKTLEVVGVLLGQNQEDKTFRITTGTQSKDPSKDFDTDLAEKEATIGIRKSFFDLVVTNDNPTTLRMGDQAQITIKYQNTLTEKILNPRITASLSGSALDRNRVSVSSDGFYESVNNLVVWDKNNNSNLFQMLPGSGGQVSFSLSSIFDSNMTNQLKNPNMLVHVKITGDRSGENGATVTSEADVVLKILTTLSLSAKSYRNVGPFSNTGPIPPRADKESTYTITWTLTNTTNDLSKVSVTTILENGVSWKGETSPTSERISYNPDTKTVVWNAGNVSSGAGFSNSPREVSFKVGFVPSLNQVSSAPDLTSKVEVLANDDYVGAPNNLSSKPINTQYSDPTYKNTDSLVQK